MVPRMTSPLLSEEMRNALAAQSIPTGVEISVFDAPDAEGLVAEATGQPPIVVETAEAASRTQDVGRLNVLLTSPEGLSALSVHDEADGEAPKESAPRVSGAVFVYAREERPGDAARYRGQGAMDLVGPHTPLETVLGLLRRGIEFRALSLLELVHRCESRRLDAREAELIGTRPADVSDQLVTHQAPPLPVGPLSTYTLDEASEAFERAYIDRVQQLCQSAREAAVCLGVSSATLSRRLRREVELDA